MGQILSHSEIESILAALDLTSSASNPATDAPAVRHGMGADPLNPSTPASSAVSPEQLALYDFEHPEPLRRSQLDALSLAAASASQSLQVSLSRVLQSSFVVRFMGVEQSTYRDFLTTTEIPSCIAVFEAKNSPGPWLFDISRTLAFTFIDCLLGGKPFETSSSAIPGRPYTEVEARLIDRAVRAFLPDVTNSFIGSTVLELSRLVDDVSLIQELTSNETVALVSFEVVSGTKQAMLQMCIPWKQVAKASKVSAVNVQDFRDAMLGGAVKIPVIATACVANMKLSASDLASLNRGDVLLTDVSSSDAMTLEVDGHPIFRGNPGQSQNHKVIRLTVPLSIGGESFRSSEGVPDHPIDSKTR